MAIETKTSVDVQTLPPFKRFIMSIGALPTSYLESMSYAELLMWFCNFLQEQVIPAVNNNADAIREIQDFLNTLDLQDEVDHKLDEMAEDGTLQEIVAEYLNANALWCFDNVADMKTATNLIDGSFARTLGYYEKNDNGSANYKIRTITNEDVVDEGKIVALSNPELIAELIITNPLTPEMFGAKGDGETDDSTSINNMINSGGSDFIFNKHYYIENTIEINEKNGFNLIGDGGILHHKSANSSNASITLKLTDCNNIKIDGLNFYSTNDYQTEVPPDHSIVSNSRSSNMNGITCVTSNKITINNCTFNGIKTAITIIGTNNNYVDYASINNIYIINTQQFLVTNYIDNILINNVNFNEMQYTQHGFHFIYAHNDTRKITLLNSNCIGRNDSTADAVIVLESIITQENCDFYAENCNISGHRILALPTKNKNCVFNHCTLTNYGDVNPASGTLVYFFTARDSSSDTDNIKLEFDDCIFKYTTNGGRLSTSNTNSKGYIDLKLNNCKLYDVTLMDTNMPTLFNNCEFILSTFMYLSNNRPTAYYCNMTFDNCKFSVTSTFAQTYMLSSRGLYGKIILKNCVGIGNNTQYFIYNDQGANVQAFNNLIYNTTYTGFKTGSSYKQGNNYLNGDLDT